ncbi:MAG: hypothetical protein DRP09_13080 [Candidatus Thorarchaeota archaeon]|nr:MAG: hypothetical protein DRP09_13080 [Candidatus Thorarchaeota archaeon]
MLLVVFINKSDQCSLVLGRKLPSYMYGEGFAKIFTRNEVKGLERCKQEETIPKLKEIATVFDSLLISFGLRLFPPSIYRDLIKMYYDCKDNIVFLKKLKGSKTWVIQNKKLSFTNYRIADAGVFIIQSKDLIESKAKTFNQLLLELIEKGKLKYRFVNYWILTNKR